MRNAETLPDAANPPVQGDAPRSGWRTRALPTLAASAALILLTVALLRAMGRVWWCACRTPTPFSTDVQSSHNSQHLLDAYSFSHLLHGVIFFWALTLLAPKLAHSTRWVIALLIEMGWEILENSPVIIDRYRSATASLGYSGDSIVNVVGDLLGCAAGFWLAGRVGWKGSVAVVVVVELTMLWLIRDNLTLNVVMLLWPIDAVRQWQSAGGG